MKGKIINKTSNTVYGNIGEYAGEKDGVKYYIGDIVIDKNGKETIIAKLDPIGYFPVGWGLCKMEAIKYKIKSYNNLKNNEEINGLKVILDNTEKEDTDVLKVDLHRYESLIYGKILYQNTDVLKRDAFKFKANNGINITSLLYPDITGNELLILGHNLSYDKDIIYDNYDTEQEAEEYFNKFQQAVKELNEKYSKLQKKEVHKESYDTILYSRPIHVNIRGRRTTVTFKDNNIKGSVYCNKQDTYDKQIGIDKAYYKAILNEKYKQLKITKEQIEILISSINGDKKYSEDKTENIYKEVQNNLKKHLEIERKISNPKLNLKKNSTIRINNKPYLIKDIQCCNEITGEYRLLLNKVPVGIECNIDINPNKLYELIGIKLPKINKEYSNNETKNIYKEVQNNLKKHLEIEQKIASPKLNLKKNNTIEFNNKPYLIKDVQCCNEITGEYRLLLNKIK